MPQTKPLLLFRVEGVVDVVDARVRTSYAHDLFCSTPWRVPQGALGRVAALSAFFALQPSSLVHDHARLDHVLASLEDASEVVPLSRSLGELAVQRPHPSLDHGLLRVPGRFERRVDLRVGLSDADVNALLELHNPSSA